MYPSAEEVKRLLVSYKAVPVFDSHLTDCQTPVSIFSALKNCSEDCFLLESVENSGQWGRYSFIGVNPKGKITINNGEAVYIKDGVSFTEKVSDPAAYLEKIINEYSAPHFAGLPRFTGGLAGYFGYDMLRYNEKTLGAPPKDDLNMPDCVLDLYDEVVAFDHMSNKVFIILNINGKSDVKSQYAACEKRALQLSEIILDSAPPRRSNKAKCSPRIKSNVTKEQYAEMVRTTKEHIVNGDIFQAVISRRFEIEDPPEPFDVYRALRATNPSPYLYYFQTEDYQIAGASPEMLLRVEEGEVTNKPIAGTSRRGKNEKEDKKLEKNLLNDEKERAEHTMLVDLGRNDVGRVCKFGTVKVHDFMHIERFSKVMHMVSEVRGELSEDKTGMDALLSVLPAGTLSGAPKIRAMQIIDELESNKRGVYGGAVGYLGFDGNIDTCITIRTALFRRGKAYVQAGGGIVADSVPENEYMESENKAAAVINAIKEAAEL